MDGPQKFVTASNISHFMTLAEHEQDAAKRAVLANILIGEEDRFGRLSERIEMADRVLGICSDRIRNQRARIEKIPGDHPHFAIANRLLENLVEIQAVIQKHREFLKRMAEDL